MTKIISVKVYPDAKRQKVIEKGEDSLEIYLKEPAQNNLANKALLRMLAEHFKVELGKVKILTGHRSQRKKVEVE